MLLLADPIVLLTPNKDADAKAWEDYRDYLLACDSLLKVNAHDITISDICRDALTESDRYPENTGELRRSLNRAGVESMDAVVLLNIINRIVYSQPTLEENIDIDIVCDSDLLLIEDISATGKIKEIQREKIQIKPTYLLSRHECSGQLLNAFHLTAGILAYAIGYCQPPIIDREAFAILTVQDSSEEYLVQEIVIDAIIEEKGKSDDGAVQIAEVNRYAELQAIVYPRDLMKMSEYLEKIAQLWPNVDQILRLVAEVNNYEVGDMSKYMFGNSFVRSAEQLHIPRKEEEIITVFNGIIQLFVTNGENQLPSPPVPTHHNHKIMSNNNPVIDNDWQAWRFHLHGDYRLHYWWHCNKHSYIFSMLKNGHSNIEEISADQSEKDALE